MDYSILIIFAILILYFIFLYKLYDERQNMVIENFDANHCPEEEAQDTNESMEISDSQFIQKEKILNKEALNDFYKFHGGIKWIVNPFLNNYYYNNNPTRTPGILIWCFATWMSWKPRLDNCQQTITIPAIFTNILCDLYTLSYDQTKRYFGYMIYSTEDHKRLKNLYTNAANLRSQLVEEYRRSHVCGHWRMKTAYDNLTNEFHEDMSYFVSRCFHINGSKITNNGRCRVPPNRVVLDYDLFKPPPPPRRRRRRGRCVIS